MTDAASDRFELGLVARLPEPLRAWAELMRLDRPIGAWLLLLPCWWGLALAGATDPWLYLLFAIGAVVMRGAGCTLNDMLDRDIDARVARTATRPLPSGRIGLAGAATLMAAQLAAGLAVLLAMPSRIWLPAVAILGVVAIYPLMKRITHWPQLVLGIAFNWGVIVGYGAGGGADWVAAALLYLAGVAWTIGYDTIYAHQDKRDDATVGVRSTALLFGRWSRPLVGLFYTATALLAAAALARVEASWPAWAGLAAVAIHLGWQVARVRFDDPASCLAWFRANTVVGWLMLAGLVGRTAVG
jgi:4-hydroxybenzoate polyprenyltransferase